MKFENIALSGPHGSGKSSLAEYVHNKAVYDKGKDFPMKLRVFSLCPSVASDVFKRYGYKQSDEITAHERMFLQNEILTRQIDEYEQLKEPFIADRSPMDMAAYMMCDAHLNRESMFIPAQAYAARCAKVTKRFFKKIVVVPFCIPYEKSDKRPPFNERYIKTWTSRLIGLLNSNNVPFIVMPEIDGIEKRAEWLAKEFRFEGHLGHRDGRDKRIRS